MSGPGEPTRPGAGTFVPAPGAAPATRMLAAQTGMELRATLRNGEQLLLSLAIPVLLLVGLSTLPLLDRGGPGGGIAFVTPGVFALAIMSTAFTGQAIKTGFERRYGVLKRLGATPLPRWGLLGAKTLAIATIEVGQLGILAAVALALGWRPAIAGVPEAAAFVVLGTAAFTGLGLLMAGTLRAEATLAGANLVYVLLLGSGGVLFPLAEFPPATRPALELLPLSALTGGLRQVLQHGAVLAASDLIIIGAWAAALSAAAALAFEWE